MKRQVIFNILDELDVAKQEAKFEGLNMSNEKHLRLGLEKAYKIVLKNADILDLRPKYMKE